MGLRDKYSQAVTTAKQLGMEGSAEEREGKLHFHGTVKSEDEKNRIWNAIKTVPEWQKEVMADIRVKAGAQPQQGGAPSQSIPQPTPAPALTVVSLLYRYKRRPALLSGRTNGRF